MWNERWGDDRLFIYRIPEFDLTLHWLQFQGHRSETNLENSVQNSLGEPLGLSDIELSTSLMGSRGSEVGWRVKTGSPYDQLPWERVAQKW